MTSWLLKLVVCVELCSKRNWMWKKYPNGWWTLNLIHSYFPAEKAIQPHKEIHGQVGLMLRERGALALGKPPRQAAWWFHTTNRFCLLLSSSIREPKEGKFWAVKWVLLGQLALRPHVVLCKGSSFPAHPTCFSPTSVLLGPTWLQPLKHYFFFFSSFR